MNEKDVAVYEAMPMPTTSAIMPVMALSLAQERRNAIVEFTKSIMIDGTDYGTIPGTNKPTLLKPGAEKLTTFFGLSTSFAPIEQELDWTGKLHGGEPFFYFQYRCILSRGGFPIGEGVGSCNSWEKKYRYRTANRICPECKKEAIIKGKQEYGGGWLCFARKGGCGQKWPDGAQVIEGQEVGQVLNDSPADLVNTIDKMAQKRALVSATLIAVNASEFFTQDLEDIITVVPTEPVQDTGKPQAEKFSEKAAKEGSDVLFGEAEKKAKTEKIQFPGWMIQGLTNAGLADNPFNANNLLNQFPELPKNTKKEEVNRLVEIYRVRRAKGTEKEIPVAEAAEVAWAEWNGS